jgi:2-(1,2-epoxy-1,2-dihydrophenyl)acetyl-CoA isomerase
MNMRLPDELLFEKQGGVAVLTLNRPSKYNALNDNIRDGIVYVCSEVSRDNEVRVLIITGAGKAFCSGADLSPNPKEKEAIEWDRSVTAPIGHYSLAIRNLEKPVIAAINGIAAGGGFGIALACDIRIASEKARFSGVWVKRGLSPDAGVTYSLPQIVGVARACEILFKGHIIDAIEAEKIGLINSIVPHDELLEKTKELAFIIAQNAPISLVWAKKALYMSRNNTFESQLHLESAAQGICTRSADFSEGVRAFLEKRNPVFTGK